MKVIEAIDLIRNLETRLKIEQINLQNALDRVLAEDVVAIDDAPRFSNSAMDGYAVCGLEHDCWHCSDAVFAGDFRQLKLSPGECCKIMTGALLPEGCEAVLMVENSEQKDGVVYNTSKPLKPGEAMRMKGEEYKKSSVLLKAGRTLDAAAIMLAAANGYYELAVFKRPKVAVFASGDELLEPYERGEGVYNSNGYGISALASRWADARYMGILADSKTGISRAILGAAECFDLVISIGSASMGEADFVKQSLQDAGYKAVFNKLSLKPGGPIALFQKDSSLVLALPGNPMSSFSCMLLLQNALAQLLGGQNTGAKSVQARLSTSVKINNNKQNLIYGNLSNGEFVPDNGGKFSSGQISPMCRSNCYVMLDSNNQEGDLVEVNFIN